MTLLTSVLQYALWPALTFAMLALWVFGILDIDRHRRRGTSTSTRLLCMVGCVSLVAIFAVASIGAVFADPWAKTVAAGSAERGTGELRGPVRSPVFSFGLENASYTPAEPTDGDGANR